MLRATLIAILLLACTASSHAFDYVEHYAITLQSFDEACANLSETGELGDFAARVCKSKRVASCLAHMAAVAGDYTTEPSELERAKELGFLDRDSENCQDILDVLTSDEADVEMREVGRMIEIQSLAPRVSCMRGMIQDGSLIARKAEGSPALIDSPAVRFWRWATLAADNATHFQPTSQKEFSDYRSDVYSKDRRSQHSVFSYHAFSLHFLEDSFAAGHIGIDRSDEKFGAWGARQDYAHAYHDDLNWGGQYLKNNSGEIWYSYGDKNLCAPTLYVDVANWPVSMDGETSTDAALQLIRSAYEHLGLELEPVTMKKEGRDFAMKLAEEFDVVATNGRQGGTVASLSIKHSPWAFCSLFVFCNKLELVVINTTQEKWSKRSLAHDHACKPVRTELLGVSMYACLDTRKHVADAALRAQLAFLRKLSDPPYARDYGSDNVSDLMPSGYAPIDFENNEHVLSSHPLIMRGEAFRSVCDPKLFANSAWGLGLSSETSAYDGSQDRSFDFSLQGRLGRQPITVRGALLTEHNSHWSVLDQLEASYDFARLTETKFRLLSLAPSVHVGIDSIMRGHEARNLYAGIGVGLEMDFGRYVVFVNFDRDAHWNDSIGRQWSSTLSMGLKIPSIDLAP
jgi:hypothetical protein